MRDVAFRGLSAVKATRKTLVIPDFLYASVWPGVSQMLARYSIGNTNPFSLKRPIIQPNETFVAAVSWAETPYVYRYKLADLGILFFPVYNGEQIGVNAYIEIWSVASAAAAINTSDWTLTASKLVLPDLCDCTVNTESAILYGVIPSSTPVGHNCNPFCDPFCS